MRIRRVIAPILLIAVAGSLAIRLPLAVAERSSVYAWFDPIVETRRILIDQFYVEPDDEAMHRAAIDGLVEALDDPYTEYIPPTLTDEFNKDLRGTYAGIGAEVGVSEGYLSIATPMDDSPALRAGILAGDLVLEIEGQSTHDLSVEDCVDLLIGPAGTEVTVLVRHLDGTEERITIVRERIVTRTVKGMRRDGEAWRWCAGAEGRIAYVRVTQFNADTVRELRGALDACRDAGTLEGLVLDLRDNPGGGLPAAVEMANLFLESGTIVSVRPRDPEQGAVYTAQTAGTLPEFPMIVIVNGNSASASEIVAGALQENGRARILGSRTFGKGSVQEVRPLDYAAGTLKFTIAQYFLPSGRSLHRRPDSTTWGVDPDPGFVVPVSYEAYAEMMRARRAAEIIRAESADDGPACADADWIRETLRDEALAVAVESLETRLASGTWPSPSDATSVEVAFGEELREATTARRNYLERLRQIDDRIAELYGLADEAGREPLLPESFASRGAIIEITGADGESVARLRVGAGDLARALETLILEPAGSEPADDANAP